MGPGAAPPSAMTPRAQAHCHRHQLPPQFPTPPAGPRDLPPGLGRTVSWQGQRSAWKRAGETPVNGWRPRSAGAPHLADCYRLRPRSGRPEPGLRGQASPLPDASCAPRASSSALESRHTRPPGTPASSGPSDLLLSTARPPGGEKPPGAPTGMQVSRGPRPPGPGDLLDGRQPRERQSKQGRCTPPAPGVATGLPSQDARCRPGSTAPAAGPWEQGVCLSSRSHGFILPLATGLHFLCVFPLFSKNTETANMTPTNCVAWTGSRKKRQWGRLARTPAQGATSPAAKTSLTAADFRRGDQRQGCSEIRGTTRRSSERREKPGERAQRRPRGGAPAARESVFTHGVRGLRAACSPSGPGHPSQTPCSAQTRFRAGWGGSESPST